MIDPTHVTQAMALLIATANAQRIRAEELALAAHVAARRSTEAAMEFTVLAEQSDNEAADLRGLLADIEEWREGDDAARHALRVFTALAVAGEQRLARVQERSATE